MGGAGVRVRFRVRVRVRVRVTVSTKTDLTEWWTLEWRTQITLLSLQSFFRLNRPSGCPEAMWAGKYADPMQVCHHERTDTVCPNNACQIHKCQ